MLADRSQHYASRLHAQLWEAVPNWLISLERLLPVRPRPRAGGGLFADPDEWRAEAHLRIGMLMAAHTPADKLEEAIFEIANQLNRGVVLDHGAGRARAAGGIQSDRRQARQDFVPPTPRRSVISPPDAALLTDDTWQQRRELDLADRVLLARMRIADHGYVARSRTAFAHAGRTGASRRSIASPAAPDASIFTWRIDRSVEAFTVYLRWLRHLVVDIPPSEEACTSEYDRIWSLLGTRAIEQTRRLAPDRAIPDSLDVLDVLIRVVMPAMFTDVNPFIALVVCRMVCLSLEHGNSDASCFAYVSLSMLAGPHFGNYDAGFRFGKLGYDLVEKHGIASLSSPVYLRFGIASCRGRQHVRRGASFCCRALRRSRTGSETSLLRHTLPPA